MKYYQVYDCRCCKQRIHIECTKVKYDYYESLIGLPFVNVVGVGRFHKCMGGIGVLELV